jgi:signal transduction histidine kinase
MTDLPPELLRQWPGRFRFAQLMVCLDDQQSPHPAALADAVLDGVMRGRDHLGVLDNLIADGHFGAARRMLAEDTDLTDRQVARGRELLDLASARYSQQLSDRLRTLADMATDADLPPGLDGDQVVRICRDSWPRALARLEQAEEELRQRIEPVRAVLQGRLRAARLPEGMATALASLVTSGRLADAAWMLDQGNLASPGPEAVPPLRTWAWKADNPEDVLGWYLDPGRRRPPEFSEWALSGDSAYRVLADYRSVSGAEATARSFADSLEAFLGPQAQRAPVIRISDGWLTKLGNVFADAEISMFGPGQAVDLFIADPGITAQPPELTDIGRLIVTGPSVDAAASASARDECAILGLRDLLRLVTVAERRPVAFLRILAQQWPLSALGAGSAAHLDALLGGDTDTQWRNLRWLTDLAGIGGLPLAGMLAFQTGYHAPVLHALLSYLADTGKVPAGSRWWCDDEQLSAEVEAAVLRDVRESPDAMLAFWATLSSAPPGEPVTLDAMVVSTALGGDGAEYESQLRRGLASLADLWCADVEGDTSVTLRPHGVIIGLRGMAQRRLLALTRQLAEQAGQAGQVRELTAWDAYRYALSQHWAAYQDALAQDGDGDLAAEARQRLIASPELLTEAAAGTDVSGDADLAKLAADMKKAFSVQYPLVSLTLEGPPSAPSGIGERIAMVLLYELLTNAAEAVPADGVVAMAIEPSSAQDGDLIMEVRDSGPGIAAEIPRDHMVFRSGVSTLGPGRGLGLAIARNLARRADGDIELIARSGRHPILRGAHFRLIVPGAPVAS